MVAVAYLVCALVWSTTWFAIRVCIGPGGYPTFPAAAMRFSIAGAVLLGLLAVGAGRPLPRTRRQLFWITAAGLSNAAGYAMIYRAEEVLPGGLVAVLFGTYPIFTAVAAAATGTERIRPTDLGAALLSLVGMAILFWDRLGISPDQAVGVGFTIAGVLGSVGFNLIVKREAGAVHPLASTAVFLSVGGLALWALVLGRGAEPWPWPPPVHPTAALLYLALCGSVLTFVCYFYLLKRVTLMTASTLVLIQPVLALVVDAVWERQVRLGARSYAGVAVVLAGVVLGVTWKRWAARRAGAAG